MANTLTKSMLLLLLILLIMIGGLVIFDWLGLVSLRREFAPVLRLVGLNAPTDSGSSQGLDAGEDGLNDARLRQQLESLEIKRKNLDETEKKLLRRLDELEERELEITRAEEQLQQQLSALEERENLYRDRNVKIEQIARNFSGMPPAQAVAQMNEMDALLVVDVLRAADRIAVEENTNSLVSYWVSQMPSKRGAEVNQFLVEKP
ncbi:hypothetical protein P0082_10700 [Candidatus Haliotispira prima]|uniref:Flagellar protein FlbB n=1 Tax=Candidatus Haliotispira prima TaxID=3034016 RepID=A0ABY8MG20_9SPIO|nr:hypothetical protein P0082_10700 [Candidatus Haliotispira prima]